MRKEVSETKINDVIEKFNKQSPMTRFYENTRYIEIPEELEENNEGKDLFRFMEALTDDEDLEMIYVEGKSGKMDAIYRTENYALKVGWKEDDSHFAEFYVIDENGKMQKLKI